jgi:hypothetical protein
VSASAAGLQGTSSGLQQVGKGADDVTKKSSGLSGASSSIGKTAARYVCRFRGVSRVGLVTNFMSGTISAASSMNETQ